MRDQDPLFHRYDFPENVRQAPQKLHAAVDALKDAEIMTDKVDELVERLVRDHMFEIPVLNVEGTTQDEEEVEVDVTHDFRRAGFGRGPLSVKVPEFRFYVPFSGPSQMFEAIPSTYGGSRPYADVRDGELVVRVRKMESDQDAASIRKEFDKTIADIKTHLQWLSNDTNGLEERLRAAAKTRIEERRAKRKADGAVADQLGFPKRERRP